MRTHSTCGHPVVLQIYDGATSQALTHTTAAALAALLVSTPLLAVPPARADYQERLEALERRKALLQKAYVDMVGVLIVHTAPAGVRTR